MIFSFALFAVSVPCRGQVGVQRIRQKCEELGTFTNMSRHCVDISCKIPWHVLGVNGGCVVGGIMVTKRTEHIKIANHVFREDEMNMEDEPFMEMGMDKQVDKQIFESAERMIGELDVSGKNALRLRLLFEEMVTMLQSLTTYYEADIWYSRNEKECKLHLSADAHVDASMKRTLIDISSDKSNLFRKGIMGRIADTIENALLHYDEVMKCQNGFGINTMVYGGLDVVDANVIWSLHSYKNRIQDAEIDSDYSEITDELEKSIIANLAKDIFVGVTENKINMTIIYEII